MTVYELIERPCGWPPSAPWKLRHDFLGESSSWYNYSTSRHLGRSNPECLNTSERLHSSPCPNMIVELLSGNLAKPWENMGLEFAKECELEDNMFVDTLVDSLVLIQGNREIHATVTGMCRSLHPLICNDGDVDVSFSDPELPFSIFVSCPPADIQYRVERLTESIVHEALHLQLTLVERAEPLVKENAVEMLIRSPWKGERRTLQGLIHGIYVFGNLREFWTDIVNQRPQSAEFGKARVSAIEAEILRRPTSHWLSQFYNFGASACVFISGTSIFLNSAAPIHRLC